MGYKLRFSPKRTEAQNVSVCMISLYQSYIFIYLPPIDKSVCTYLMRKKKEINISEHTYEIIGPSQEGQLSLHMSHIPKELGFLLKIVILSPATY